MVYDADEEDRPDRERLGAALAFLRERQGLTQEDAAPKAGYSTSQGWARFEQGKSPSIFRPAQQRRLAAAIGVTVEEWLMVAAARQALAAQPPSALGEKSAWGSARPGAELVPILGRAEAGSWSPIDDLADTLAKPSPLDRDAKYPRAAQWARRHLGESMNLAGLLDGDLVHVVSAADINYWPMDDHLVEVERRRQGEDGVERERQIRAVKVTRDGVLLLARSTNKKWTDAPLVLAEGQPQPDGLPRITGLVLATHRKLT